MAAPAAAAPPPAQPRGGADDPLAEKLRHCPTAVEAASVHISDVADGVEFVITAASTEAAQEIRRRASYLAEYAAGHAQATEHGGGKGGGKMRNCPIVTSDTTITATDIENGVTIVVTSKDRAQVASLRTESRRRWERAAR